MKTYSKHSSKILLKLVHVVLQETAPEVRVGGHGAGVLLIETLHVRRVLQHVVPVLNQLNQNRRKTLRPKTQQTHTQHTALCSGASA